MKINECAQNSKGYYTLWHHRNSTALCVTWKCARLYFSKPVIFLKMFSMLIYLLPNLRHTILDRWSSLKNIYLVSKLHKVCQGVQLLFPLQKCFMIVWSSVILILFVQEAFWCCKALMNTDIPIFTQVHYSYLIKS